MTRAWRRSAEGARPSAHREDLFGLVGRRYPKLQVDLIAGALKVFEHHVVIARAELDFAAGFFRWVLAVVVDDQLAVDQELGAVVARNSEAVLAGLAQMKGARVANGKPL